MKMTAEQSDDRHLRAAPQCQQDAERQRGHHADRGDDDGDEDAAPQRRRHDAKPDPRRAVKQHERQDRQHDEEIQRADVATRRRQPQQPDDAERQSEEEQIDPPALADRVEAVDEVGRPDAHERPAGAGLRLRRRSQAGVAVGSGPDRVDQEKPQQRRHRPDDEQDADQRQRHVGRARKKIAAQPAHRAGARRRRRQPLGRRAADIEQRLVADGAHPAQRSTIAVARA